MAIKTKLEDMIIGDIIACRYKAGGFFSELGTCVMPELPLAGSANPDGLFYFRKVDTGLLIADRVVQHSISWDTLNSLGLIQGKTLPSIITNITTNSTITYETDGTLSMNLVGSAHKGGCITLLDEKYSVGGNDSVVLKFKDYRDACWNSAINNGIWFNLLENVASYDIYYGAPRVSYGYATYNTMINIPINTYVDWEYTVNFKLGTIAVKMNGVSCTPSYSLCNIMKETDRLYIQIGVGNYSNSNIYKVKDVNISINSGPPVTVDLRAKTNRLIRSLSGGNSYLDENGKSSLTDKVLGAWPYNNEWDKYIVKSTLNGTITAGDDKVWNWSSWSWVQDTPSTNVVAKNGQIATSGYRTLRGHDDGVSKVQRFNCVTSTITNVIGGFRPVLEYIEPKSKATTLFY